MSSTSIPIKNMRKQQKNNQSLGEILGPWFIAMMKSTAAGLLTMLVFIFSPVWNYPERMKQITHWLVIAFGAIVILWGFYWIGQRPVFNIEQIVVQSANDQELDHIKVPAIKAKAVSQFSGNFFTLRLNEARTAFEELPWVRVASVRRVWPNQIQVSIEEHEPVGVWLGQNGPELMNNYGELFTVNLAEANDRKNLVLFQGPPNTNKEVLALYQQLQTWFNKLNYKVVALTLSPRYSWTVKLDNGLTFELGRDLNDKDRKQITERLDRFFALWPELEKKLTVPVNYVDLRYNKGFSLGTGSKVDNRSSEIKLAGLNQHFSLPLEEYEESTTNNERPAHLKMPSPQGEMKTEPKLNKREVKKVKQSETMGSKRQ
jgi:cell division protein FtsQ